MVQLLLLPLSPDVSRMKINLLRDACIENEDEKKEYDTLYKFKDTIINIVRNIHNFSISKSNFKEIVFHFGKGAYVLESDSYVIKTRSKVENTIIEKTNIETIEYFAIKNILLLCKFFSINTLLYGLCIYITFFIYRNYLIDIINEPYIFIICLLIGVKINEDGEYENEVFSSMIGANPRNFRHIEINMMKLFFGLDIKEIKRIYELIFSNESTNEIMYKSEVLCKPEVLLNKSEVITEAVLCKPMSPFSKSDSPDNVIVTCETRSEGSASP